MHKTVVLMGVMLLALLPPPAASGETLPPAGKHAPGPATLHAETQASPANSNALPPDATEPSPHTAEATPSALESRFVTFQKHFPLRPGSLDLFGYEREKVARGYPILSPDRCLMAVTEVFYLPDNRQTYSRVFLLPVGRPPRLEDILPPEEVEAINAKKARYQHLYPGYTPQVDVNQVDPHVFWDRYNPEKHMAHRRTIFEAGFDTIQPYRSDIIQVVDWSQDGDRLLMIIRPGVHHLGIRRTIPVIYHRRTHETVRLTLLPKLVYNDLMVRHPELKKSADRVWDVRPLGWHAQHPDQFIVKGVLFEGQSEVSAGLWRYSLKTGMLHYLGNTVDAALVARNGWLVSFVDPTAEEGPVTYGPGETPPPKTQEPEPQRSWRSRLLFWKKQR